MKLTEAYIKAEKGNIYYTKNSDMFLSMVKSIFISKNIPVRVYYDITKGLYVFGDAFNYIHADLANGMKYYSNIYGPDEMRTNVSYLRQNCALFQVLPDDDFKKYDVGDGYTDGWFLKIDDLIFACRNKQYHKLRDEVPLFKDHIGEWMPTDYYIAKKQGLTESVEEKIIAYHGSQHKKFNFRDDKVLYLTTDKKKAESYAKREWDEGLIEGEIPVVYTFEISVKNPYVCHTENEFQSEFCDVNMNLEGGKEELIEKGYDSIKYKDLIGVFSSSQIKLVNTEVLPPSMDYYYPKDTKYGDEDINDYYYDGEELDESVENDTDEKLNSKTNCKIVLKDGKTIYGHLLSVNENYVYINSNNGNRIKKDNIKELYMYYDCEVITKNGKTIYGNFVGDFGDHKLHLDDSFNRKGWAIKDEMIEKVNYKKVIKHTFDTDTLNESIIDDKTFYTKQLSRMLNICLNIGNARFIYIPEAKLYVIGDAHNNTHISLFISALNEGKFDIGENNVDEYFDEYINSAEDTGAIITKEYANDNNIWMKSPDSTNVINDYGKFYLCNGLCIEDSLAELTNIKPKYVKYISYLDESVEDKILYIIRGVPGSGKSTLAHKLTDNVVEADQYFYDDKGNYNWSADKLNQAHNWCFYTVKKYMEEGRDKIAVANTFVKKRDYKRYVELAEKFGYKVDIRVCNGNFKNIHGVPDETVERMRAKFQLDESIAYASKKDLSDIILKNPTRKELKENGLEFCRYMFEDDNTYYFVDAKEYSHLDISQLFLDTFKNYNLHTDGGYYSVKENCFYIRNDFGCEKNKERLDNTKLLHKLFGNFKSIIYEGDYPEEYSKELDESAENDRTLRDYAVKLANICLDALVKTKYETKISKDQVQINVDKAFKKAVPMLKNSPYEYFIILVSKNDEPNASYGKSIDRKYGLITLPVFSKDPIDQTLSILYKHKSMLNKLYSTYSGDELKLKINEYAIKYLKKELEKSLSNVKSVYLDILIHECTHLLDELRRTKTYKSKEQNLKDDKGIKDYFNSPEEQNAYYQETISAFDEWIKSEDWKKDWKNFNNFQNEFIRQYKGDYDKLNNINKRKLKKRIYAYWELYIKD